LPLGSEESASELEIMAAIITVVITIAPWIGITAADRY
jgi:hypothetical protein